MDLSNNPFIKELPEKYNTLLGKFQDSDSVFFVSAIDNYSSRELVIGSKTGGYNIKTAKFNSKIYLKNQAKPLEINLTNNGVVYNYNERELVLFKTKLPFTEIEKIIVEQKSLDKSRVTWTDSILRPFKTITPYDLKNDDFVEGFKTQPNTYKVALFKLLDKFNIQYLPTELILENNKLFDSFTPLDIFSSQENLTILEVKNPNIFWRQINLKKELEGFINLSGDYSQQIKTQLKSITEGETKIESLFDLKKLADYNAVMNLFTSNCDDPIYFKLNKETDKLEPLYVNSNCLGTQLKYLQKPILNDVSFIDQTIASYNNLVSMNLEEDIVRTISNLQEKLALINSFYPENIFDIDILKTNQKVINKSLNPSTPVEVQLLKIDNNNATFIIKNLCSYPVKIQEFSYKGEKNICSPESNSLILSNHTDTINFKLPRSFENLFVSKKNKKVGFRLEKDIYDLFMGVSTKGLDNLRYMPILPYKDKEIIEVDIFRDKHDLNNYSIIKINEEKKTITFSSKQVTINQDLIIPQGFQFIIYPGTSIDIVNNAKILSHSPVFFQGTKVQPIKVLSSDKTGQGLLVLAQGLESKLNYVSFDNLTNPKKGSWNVTGAITFYESPVTLNHTSISNNRCEDALNIIRTHFRMSNSKISLTQSDAFDGDFVKGIIESCSFENLGNDGIDISGSDLTIKKVIIKNAGDKGLSAGEDSKMTVENVEIYNSEIAVAGKDLSIVDIKTLKIDQTKLGFTAFQKKPEFGPSNITVKGLTMNNVETNYLIENSSSLVVDGKKIETSQNVKDRMYGVEFGRSSVETRNSQ